MITPTYNIVGTGDTKKANNMDRMQRKTQEMSQYFLGICIFPNFIQDKIYIV